MENNNTSTTDFQKKVWIASAIVSFFVLLIWMIKITFSVILLVFAGILLAVFLQAFASLAQKYFKMSENWSIGTSIMFTFLLTLGLFFLIGAKIQTQTAELVDTIPSTIEAAKNQLSQSDVGNMILNQSTSDATIKKLKAFGEQFFTSTFGVLGDLYVILFIGIFLAIAPQTYKQGFVLLIPEAGQSKAIDLLNKMGLNLKNWMKGKLFSMLVVGIFTAIGLALLGIKLWLVLAILAGLISFIPNFGPVIALIPAVLIALLDGPDKALMVIGLYVLIQFLESNFITPLVQQKMINLPPAMILTVQLFMGSLTGGWGLILATPIAVIVIILVQNLYIKKETVELD
jgi:predicted PurR-regulated permease PerM